MDIIRKQATLFWHNADDKSDYSYNYEPVISSIRIKILDYHKIVHRVIFMNELQLIIKKIYEKHLIECLNPENCEKNAFYENLLFFINEDIQQLESQISSADFTPEEAIEVNKLSTEIIDRIKSLQLGHEIIYEDVIKEINEMKEFLFLNKKNWVQILSGKLTEMIASGIISEVTAKDLVRFGTSTYHDLFK